MTLNTKIGIFMDFLAIFWLQDTFQEQIVPKSLQIGRTPCVKNC